MTRKVTERALLPKLFGRGTDAIAQFLVGLVTSLTNLFQQYGFAINDLIDRTTTLETNAVSSFPDLSDTPTSYSGSANLALAVNASADGVVFVAFPVKVSTARVSRTTTQTIPGGSLTKMQFNSVDHDPDGLWDAANSQFIMPSDAAFVIASVNAHWDGNSTGLRFLELTGTVDLGRDRRAATGESEQSVSGMAALTNGNIVSALVFQNSGGSLDLRGSGYTNLSITVFRS